MDSIEEIIIQLDSKFESWHPTADYKKYKKWSLVSWDYYGADQGLELVYYTDKQEWVIRQMLESGYVEGKELITTKDYQDIYHWVIVLAPTNKEYKIQRK